MKKICMLFALIVLLTGLAAPDAQAVVIYDTFGPGDAFLGTGYAFSGSSTSHGDVDIGAAFVPTGTYALDSIEVATSFGSGTNAVDFYLMTDSAGVPGTVIETFSFADQMVADPGSILFGTSALNPILNAGTQYWLVVNAPAADTVATWNLPDPFGAVGLIASGSGLGSWATASVFEPAFRINGVPEPATMLLLGFGFMGVGVARKKLK